MSTDLDRLLDEGFPATEIARPDVQMLWNGGQRRRRNRRVGAVIAGMLILAAVGAGLSQLPGTVAVPFIDGPDRDGRSEPDPDGDDAVTFQEYRSEVERIVGCLRSQEYAIEYPLEGGGGGFIHGVDPDLLLSWGWTSPTTPSEHETAAFDRAQAQCGGEWNPIVQAWEDHVTPSAAARKLAIEAALACGIERGMQLAPLEEIMGPDVAEEMSDELRSEQTDSFNAMVAVLDHGCRPWEALD